MQHMNKTQLPLWGSITQGGRLYSPLQAPWLSTEPLTPCSLTVSLKFASITKQVALGQRKKTQHGPKLKSTESVT